MRRVSPRLITLVLVALVAIGGGAQTASASDAGLRKLVSQQRAAEKRVTAKASASVKRIGRPQTIDQYRQRFGRHLRSLNRLFLQEARAEERYRARFRAEAPQTDAATRGRSLIVLGLRDGSTFYRVLARRMTSLGRVLRRVRTIPQLERFARRFDRSFGGAAGSRSDRRLKRGRTLIRNAPKVPSPTPVPTPVPPVTPTPTPAPPTTTTPAPPSLIPGLL